mgnify:CR=1 FL=1
MVTTRPEHEAAQAEYESFLTQSNLSRGDLQHIALEEVDFLESFTAADVSGVLIGASPYNADTPAAEKTRSQQYVEDQIRELLAVVLKEGIPLLATGVALQVLAAALSYLTPVMLGGGPATTRVTNAIMDRAADYRVVAANSCLLPAVLPVLPWTVRLTCALAAGAVASYVPIGMGLSWAEVRRRDRSGRGRSESKQAEGRPR